MSSAGSGGIIPSALRLAEEVQRWQGLGFVDGAGRPTNHLMISLRRRGSNMPYGSARLAMQSITNTYRGISSSAERWISRFLRHNFLGGTLKALVELNSSALIIARSLREEYEAHGRLVNETTRARDLISLLWPQVWPNQRAFKKLLLIILRSISNTHVELRDFIIGCIVLCHEVNLQ